MKIGQKELSNLLKTSIQKFNQNEHVNLFFIIMVIGTYSYTLLTAFYQIYLNGFILSRMLGGTGPHTLNCTWISLFGIGLLYYTKDWLKSIVWCFWLVITHESIWTYLYLYFNTPTVWGNYVYMVLFYSITFVIFLVYLFKTKKAKLFFYSILPWAIFTNIYFVMFPNRITILPVPVISPFKFDVWTNVYEIVSVLFYVICFTYFIKRVETKRT